MGSPGLHRLEGRQIWYSLCVRAWETSASLVALGQAMALAALMPQLVEVTHAHRHRRVPIMLHSQGCHAGLMHCSPYSAAVAGQVLGSVARGPVPGEAALPHRAGRRYMRSRPCGTALLLNRVAFQQWAGASVQHQLRTTSWSSRSAVHPLLLAEAASLYRPPQLPHCRACTRPLHDRHVPQGVPGITCAATRGPGLMSHLAVWPKIHSGWPSASPQAACPAIHKA